MGDTTSPMLPRFHEALRRELARQDRASWFSAVAAVTTLPMPPASTEAKVDLSHASVDDPVVAAIIEAIVGMSTSVREVQWTLSLRGNPGITDASAPSCALLLNAVKGVASVDLFGTSMTKDGVRVVAATAAKLVVKPTVTLPSGETLSSSASGASAAAKTTTTSTGPTAARVAGRPGGASATSGRTGSKSSGSSSSVDIAALRKRRDELFRREGILAVEDAHREAERIEAHLTGSSRSSVSSGESPSRPSRASTNAPAARGGALQQRTASPLQPVATGPSHRGPPSGDALDMRSGTLVSAASGSAPSPTGGAASPLNASASGNAAVLQRQLHPAQRQKHQQLQQQQQQHVGHHGGGGGGTVTAQATGPLNPNMISSATIAVHHQRRRSASLANTPQNNSMHSAPGSRPGTATGGGPSERESRSGYSPDHDGDGAASAGGSRASAAPSAKASDRSGSEETTATEMPDRQDDVDVMQNLAPHDRALNLCQTMPRVPSETLLDPARLQHLTVLNIAQNGLHTICNLPRSLMRLDASGNELESVDGLTGCNLLVVVNLRRNRIREISALENCLALKHLFLGRNELRRVSGLGHILGLESLDVSFNRIKSESAIRALSQNSSLKHLILYGNPVAARASTKGIRGLLRNLVPTLIAVDNERLPTSVAPKSRASPPPRTASFDDRSAFLGVQERLANMSVAERSRVNASAANNTSGAAPQVDTMLSVTHANVSMTIDTSALTPSQETLAMTQASNVAGYSSHDRVAASAQAMDRAAKQVTTIEKTKRANQPRVTRKELQRLVELRNASLVERTMADRIASDMSASPSGTIGAGDHRSPQQLRAADSLASHPADQQQGHGGNAADVFLRNVQHGAADDGATPPPHHEHHARPHHSDPAAAGAAGFASPPNARERDFTLDAASPSPGRHSRPLFSPGADGRSAGMVDSPAPPNHSNGAAFSPIGNPHERTDVSIAEPVPALAQSQPAFSPARGAAAATASSNRTPTSAGEPQQPPGVGAALSESAIVLKDLQDPRDPSYVREWVERVDEDDRSTYLALRTLLVVLEHEPAVTTGASKSAAAKLSPDADRCIDVIEHNGLAEDLALPAEVADYFAFTDEELDAEMFDPVAAAAREDPYGLGSGRRAKLLQALHSMSENKTCIRYLVALVRSARFDAVRKMIEHTRGRLDGVASAYATA